MAATPTQGILLEIPEQPLPEPVPPAEPGERKLKPIERRQMMWTMICAEDLIGHDHKARAIWDLTGRLDLSRFAKPIRSERGRAGRPAWDPRLLVSIWLYAYSEGMSSARRIAQWMSHEPGLRWLSGFEVVNHHTLSDFRVSRREALDELFADLLGLLEEAEVISLERVMHDGTKIRAQAGSDSFRKQKTLQQREKGSTPFLSLRARLECHSSHTCEFSTNFLVVSGAIRFKCSNSSIVLIAAIS